MFRFFFQFAMDGFFYFSFKPSVFSVQNADSAISVALDTAQHIQCNVRQYGDSEVAVGSTA